MNELTLNIYIISRCTHHYYARELRKLHVTMGQFPFVMGIAGNDGVSQEKLSAGLKISKSTTAAMVRQLMDAGFVSRETDETDRRNFRLHVTEKGKELVPKIEAVIRRCHELITEDLTEIERDAFAKLTEKVRKRTETTLRK